MKVLIIKLGALGDVIMATPLIRAIQQHHTDADISLLTTPAYQSIFAAWPDLNVIVRPRRGLLNTAATIRVIRALACDRIYDLQANDRSGLWCALSGVHERVGNHPRFPYTHHPKTQWQGQSHIFERMLEVLSAAGVDHVAAVPYLPIEDATRTRVDTWLVDHALRPQHFALLHAGASAARPEKRWPHFAALASIIRDKNLTPVWLGGEAERELNAELSENVGGIDASNEFSIVEIAALARSARFAVTNDSGPMHAIAASGIPIFALFGPSDWRRNHALGQRDTVLACVEHCGAHRGQKTADCLAELSADFVWSRIQASGKI